MQSTHEWYHNVSGFADWFHKKPKSIETHPLYPNGTRVMSAKFLHQYGEIVDSNRFENETTYVIKYDNGTYDVNVFKKDFYLLSELKDAYRIPGLKKTQNQSSFHTTKNDSKPSIPKFTYVVANGKVGVVYDESDTQYDVKFSMSEIPNRAWVDKEHVRRYIPADELHPLNSIVCIRSNPSQCGFVTQAHGFEDESTYTIAWIDASIPKGEKITIRALKATITTIDALREYFTIGSSVRSDDYTRYYGLIQEVYGDSPFDFKLTIRDKKGDIYTIPYKKALKVHDYRNPSVQEIFDIGDGVKSVFESRSRGIVTKHIFNDGIDPKYRVSFHGGFEKDFSYDELVIDTTYNKFNNVNVLLYG
jgi:hypothetical protein